jgi:hypothetical protein|tara:strand:+ start:2923 stop:3156 length:234 start_codon:yes stop_codon:yes gene_type:complete
MEENEEVFRYLDGCALISENLDKCKLSTKSKVNLSATPEKYIEILREIEDYVKMRVDRTQPTISLTIGRTEFIFTKI